jgi:metallo-beta-lactamase family protein
VVESADVAGAKSNRRLTLKFLGAAGTVTGSKFLLAAERNTLLIDCGLFQGIKQNRLRNWEPFPEDQAAIGAIVLTHAHLDHSGYLPAICRDGFNGRVYCTPETIALSRIVLPDSGHLQEEEANFANRKGYSKHHPALPLYTEEEAWRSLNCFSAVPFDSGFETGGFNIKLLHAGHILGASSALVESTAGARRRILFSGDLGRPSHPVIREPERRPEAEVIVVESTYGDRRHNDTGCLALFRDAIVRTGERGGVIIIPAFAVDRTEVILFYLRQLQLEKRIPDMPIYVDSPMALAGLKVYEDAIAAGHPSIRSEIAGRPEVLKPRGLVEIKSAEESKALNDLDGPMIIIAASGMATGGRVLHHLERRLPSEKNTVVLVGYQPEGTRGRSLLERATTVKMLGRYVPVRAEVIDVPAFSVHADQPEIIAWLRGAPAAPEMIYVVHGERAASQQLCAAIGRELGWNAVAPRYLESVRLD